MSNYKVLYRKYRPSTFDEIVGQNEIVKAIKNSILNNSIPHAYIFTGPRGTGKTSTAKVLAKTINCENITNSEACGKCSNCQNFANSPDIIEIDAASNNGVDEIRELRNNVTLTPANSKYKVYIIDEVHMLSTGAFNALLKTLEEPPSHIIFILATTEVYKVPITILSRCQRYDFKKISKNDMIESLKSICVKENIHFEIDALEELHDISEGCMRDALSLLDQLHKLTENITKDTVLKNYNIISIQVIEQLIEYIFTNQIKSIVETVDNFENSGMNSQKVIKKIINYLENLAIKIKLNEEKRYDFTNIKILIEELNKIYIDARVNENTFAMLKLAFLSMCKSDKILVTEKAETQECVTTSSENSTLSKTEIRINNCFVDADKKELTKLKKIWNEVNNETINGIDLKAFEPTAASPTYAIFKVEEQSLADLFNIKTEIIEKILKKNGFDIKIVGVSESRWKTEKSQYVTNYKNGKKYTYIEELAQNDEIKEIENKVRDVFDDMTVEVS